MTQEERKKKKNDLIFGGRREQVNFYSLLTAYLQCGGVAFVRAMKNIYIYIIHHKKYS